MQHTVHETMYKAKQRGWQNWIHIQSLCCRGLLRIFSHSYITNSINHTSDNRCHECVQLVFSQSVAVFMAFSVYGGDDMLLMLSCQEYRKSTWVARKFSYVGCVNCFSVWRHNYTDTFYSHILWSFCFILCNKRIEWSVSVLHHSCTCVYVTTYFLTARRTATYKLFAFQSWFS
jgi:hypothetical protein